VRKIQLDVDVNFVHIISHKSFKSFVKGSENRPSIINNIRNK